MNTHNNVKLEEQNCIFCKIISGQLQSKIIYQTELSIVIQDIAPQAPIHYLIIPKMHVQDLSSCKDKVVLADLLSIPVELAEQTGHLSYKLVTNNGYAAGQRVFHLHFHFMAGKEFS